MQLSVNKIWAGMMFLTAGFLTILFFNWCVAIKNYARLDSKTMGSVETFHVRQLQENAYGIEASYAYEVEGKLFQGKQVLTHPIFLNAVSAKSHLEKYWRPQPWPIWYQNKDPTYASLQKIFPVKKTLGFAICLAVFVYFIGLRRYVSRQID
jgi:hypothetical protein